SSRGLASWLGLSSVSHRRLAVSNLDSRARDVLQSRSSDGFVSLITLQPLRKKGRAASRAVSVSQIQWLRAHGLLAVLDELISLKSDDVTARDQTEGSSSNVQLWQAIAGRRGVGSPESLALFAA